MCLIGPLVVTLFAPVQQTNNQEWLLKLEAAAETQMTNHPWLVARGNNDDDKQNTLWQRRAARWSQSKKRQDHHPLYRRSGLAEFSVLPFVLSVMHVGLCVVCCSSTLLPAAPHPTRPAQTHAPQNNIMLFDVAVMARGKTETIKIRKSSRN